MSSNQITKLGVGLVILRDGQVLLSKRRNAHGSGSYAGPGGNLGYMESPRAAVLRELREECGPDLKVSDPRFLCVVHWEEYKPIHYIGFGFVADYLSGTPQVTEPDKFEGWQWYDVANPPTPLFGVMASYIQAVRQNQTYIES